MEYCEHGDIYTYLQAARNAGRAPEESRLIEWLVQIAWALAALHQEKILHRDLKTQNIFLTGPGDQDRFALKLGDFGVAKALNSTGDLARTQIGTPFYMSPELINSKPYSYKSDIWGLGCVLYEIISGHRAFDAQSLNGLALKIIKGNYTPITARCSQGTKSLIKAMLSKSPAHRPTLKEILHMSSIRPRITAAQHSVLCSAPPEERSGIEALLTEQLVGLGLGSLVNCPASRPQRDRQRLLQKLEKAEKNHRREEQNLQRTAALLAQCLADPGAPTIYEDVAARQETSFQMPPVNLPHRDLQYNDLDYDDSQEETMRPAMSHRDRVLMQKERRREEAEQRFEEEARKIREENLAHQRARANERAGSRVQGVQSEMTAQPMRARSRTETDVSANHSSVSWHVDCGPPVRPSLSNPYGHDGRKQVHSPRSGLTGMSSEPRRRTRATSHHDGTEPSPPPLQYGEPSPPQSGPTAPMVGQRSWRQDDRPRASQPRSHRSVCLEALSTPGFSDAGFGAAELRGRSCSSRGSESRASLSDDEFDGDSDGSASNMPQGHRNARKLQQRIDACHAAIYRLRMTIGMLQNEAAESEAPYPDRPAPTHGGAACDLYGDDAHGARRVGASAPPAVQDCTARLARRCVEGLGSERFAAAKRCLQALQDAAEAPGGIRGRMLELLGAERIGFLSLLDQLVHMERTWGVQDVV
eukprot:TRINITY_DN25621_c0_g1_i2.p1 TRINITY_DN25621_c0_g1~~TRINITY_DN25621_c0_g1_i2.p1  ORF type:complete len:814 (-),score=167.37 TRINITY_DN25621_c0_g1_i2:73-2172(-)